MKPLASVLRPEHLNEFIGQAHLLSEKKPLYEAVTQGRLHSMVLWGPPGVGKTTLARLLARQSGAEFETLSAVMAGVKDIRAVVARAEKRLADDGISTVLFVDEVHRFNKSQQDAFLPYVESGLLTFIGATTENPSFELNGALLSRCSVYVLKPLTQDELTEIAIRALTHCKRTIEDLTPLIAAANGDARLLLNFISIASEMASSRDVSVIPPAVVNEVIKGAHRHFDKGGDNFYEQISALHKSIRGSDPDAALFWCLQILEGGASAHYVLRRLVRAASEDIGNADPRALTIALDAWRTYDYLGDEEGRLAIAQAVIYLAVAAKSNAVYVAFNQASTEVKKSSRAEVPMHLRNAPTKLMKSMDYRKSYRYAHDHPNAYVPGEQYFPDGMSSRYYYPTNRGLEKKIAEKLAFLQQLDEEVDG